MAFDNYVDDAEALSREKKDLSNVQTLTLEMDYNGKIYYHLERIDKRVFLRFKK